MGWEPWVAWEGSEGECGLLSCPGGGGGGGDGGGISFGGWGGVLVAGKAAGPPAPAARCTAGEYRGGGGLGRRGGASQAPRPRQESFEGTRIFFLRCAEGGRDGGLRRCRPAVLLVPPLSRRPPDVRGRMARRQSGSPVGPPRTSGGRVHWWSWTAKQPRTPNPRPPFHPHGRFGVRRTTSAEPSEGRGGQRDRSQGHTAAP